MIQLTSVTHTDIAGMERFYRANLINSLSGFKSINLVGTISKTGLTNLAVFSQVMHIGANPPLMGLLFRPDVGERHTLHNLLDTGYFTLNHVQESFYRQAHQTSARYQSSEFEACGLTPLYTSALPAPYVAEAAIRIGLQFREKIDIQLNGTILVIGQVLELTFPPDCLAEDGYLDIEKAGSIAGSALDGYHTTQRLSRLAYAKPDKFLKELN
jgi:flavin reductase (DIM6/NTAB) family NADH-FMN oxidoreductase RutF